MVNLNKNVIYSFDRTQLSIYRKPCPSRPLDRTENKETKDNEIKDLFPQTLSTSLREKITNRYKQITEQLNGIVSPAIQFRLALFVESQFEKIACATRFTFKKKMWGISHSLLIHDGSIYIKNIKPLGSGSFKQVNAALALPLQHTAKTANLVALTASKEGIKAEDLHSAIDEMNIHCTLKNVPGIWPIHFWFQYTAGTSQDLEKIVSVLDIAEGNLLQLPDLTLQEELLISRDLIIGLYSMHIRKLIHGDIKNLNALFRKEENGKFTVGLTDFGHTFCLLNSDPHVMYSKGCYGTVIHTAPELFGNTTFIDEEEANYYKIDIWAFGMMLYQLHFKKSPPWINNISACCTKETKTLTKVTEWDRNNIKKIVQKRIETPLAYLEQKKELTKKEKFERLIYQMLRYEPTTRIDMKNARAEIETMIQGNLPDNDDCCIIT